MQMRGDIQYGQVPAQDSELGPAAPQLSCNADSIAHLKPKLQTRKGIPANGDFYVYDRDHWAELEEVIAQLPAQELSRIKVVPSGYSPLPLPPSLA